MTISRLTFKSLKEMQETFFHDKFGMERGGRLVRIMVDAALAYDYDGANIASLPYYIYAAVKLGHLNELSDFLPPKTQIILTLPQIDASNLDSIRIVAPSFWERADVKDILVDYVDAVRTQAELTQRYFQEQVHDIQPKVFRAVRSMNHVFSSYTDRDPRRMVFSGTLDAKIARRFAGVTGDVVYKNIPVEKLLDSYLTNVGFIHKEYEIRYLRLDSEDD